MTAPVRREVLVDAAPDRAFEVFTEQVGQWWPLDRFGVFGDGTVAFEGGLLVERSGDRQSIWGEVTEWAPPSMLAMTWHPGYETDRATDIRVTFEAQGEQTLVTLVHSGWERMTDPDAAAEEYGSGWPGVLRGFAALASAP